MLMLPLEVPKGRLPDLLSACRTMNIHYLCPTMPHKGDIIPFLDDVDELSRVFHSVNAVKIDPDGTSHGVGMDGRGTVNALLAAGVKLDGARVLLAGAGAICGVIGVELSRQGVRNLQILNRTRENAHAAVMDVVLNPSVTSIRRRAMERGLKTVPGMEMLLGQMDAIFGYLWDVKLTDKDKTACARALCAHLGVESPR